MHIYMTLSGLGPKRQRQEPILHWNFYRKRVFRGFNGFSSIFGSKFMGRKCKI